MRCLDSITNSMVMNLSKLQEIVEDRGFEELDMTWQLNSNISGHQTHRFLLALFSAIPVLVSAPKAGPHMAPDVPGTVSKFILSHWLGL